ncbi:tail fiber domain-containing protein [Shewanella waksmanii]|uniref:tail fiber domain-containing protein n=1 Tax=Shewanella waksmanii TaxID=213783 RepID=UPI0004BCB8E0|nr:tail fiber domain-containing protein [Shewanella waksmanii]
MNYIKLGALTLLPLTLAISSTTLADQVILDDLIINGSNCVGQDCVNGESFGFDTIRLKENNVRIKFQDTSASASFPSNDWQLTANDSSNGGANKFSIDDIDGSRTPFTVEAGAQNHAVYIDDGGRVGFGTNLPVVELHVVDGDTATLRLEQDGSSGFTPQTWDIAGNETNFFIRDATGGSSLPFRIRAGAPENSIFIDTDGDIGLGDASPDAALDIESGDLLVTNGQVRIGGDANTATAFGVETTLDIKSSAGNHNFVEIDTTDTDKVTEVIFSSAGTPQWVQSGRNSLSDAGSTPNRLAYYNSSVEEVLTIHQNGSIYIGDSPTGTNNTTHAIEVNNGAHLTAGGAWTNASSRELKNSIKTITTDSAIAALKALNPVTYRYNSEPDELYAGFIAEDVPEIVAMKDRKSLSSMDMIAVLTKVIQQQQAMLEVLEEKVDSMNK